ncbi:MAG: carboxypeptidase C (cathepsin A) [Verrucomicrobiales bacterium]|jgi:carboxypeptidase C (cathepsin A)
MYAALVTLLSALILIPASLDAATVNIGGEQMEYRAEAGTIEIKNDRSGKLRGRIFYTGYQRSDLKPRQRNKRPVLFLFNGGPGSSSAWLHLGAFGPRRVVLGEAGLVNPPKPYRTTPNQYSLLDIADLVFVDPISTGFSRAADPIAARGFYGFRNDCESIATFIKLYLEQEGRSRSPCLLAGESYGAMRACGLVPELEEHHGIVVNGIILISGPIVMGQKQPADLALPTAAATAHYHGLLGARYQALDREDLLKRVDDFSRRTYRPALGGQTLDDEERERITAQLRDLTGLDRLRGLRYSLREVRVNTTRKLGVESIGAYDTRVTTKARRGLFRGATGDPALAVIREPMDAVIGDYLTTELGYQTDLDYRLMVRIPMWSHSGSKASETLTRAFQTNRGLRVMVACGYYDTVTPMAVVKKAVEDAKLTPEQRRHLRFKNYEGGHMMYTNLPTLEKLSRDLRAFIREASARKRGPALVPASTCATCNLKAAS